MDEVWLQLNEVSHDFEYRIFSVLCASLSTGKFLCHWGLSLDDLTIRLLKVDSSVEDSIQFVSLILSIVSSWITSLGLFLSMVISVHLIDLKYCVVVTWACLWLFCCQGSRKCAIVDNRCGQCFSLFDVVDIVSHLAGASVKFSHL